MASIFIELVHTDANWSTPSGTVFSHGVEDPLMAFGCYKLSPLWSSCCLFDIFPNCNPPANKKNNKINRYSKHVPD